MLWGQTQDGQETTDANPNAIEAQIIGRISDAPPSEPAPPPVKLVISPEDVLESKTVEVGERQITVEKITPIELPPVPEPPPPPDPLDPAVQARIQEMRETRQSTHFVMIGATVYRSRPSRMARAQRLPRGVVRAASQSFAGLRLIGLYSGEQVAWLGRAVRNSRL